MKPRRADSCRVLELGCGDGLNLLAMAVALPGSQFTGIDLAEVPIARGVEMARELNLSNVQLHARDLLAAPDDLGEFDFIIAHGLYSWVPEPVREKVLAVCARNLASDGVAYVSYNAQPGNHFRELARGLMRFHTAGMAEAEEQIAQAKAILKFMAAQAGPSSACNEAWKQELQRVERYPSAALFHDDLSPVNRAFYFHEFAAAAARHGLQYLAEADATDMQTDGLPPDSVQLLERFGPDQVIAREQYLDFFRARAFRQTLLCHHGATLDRSPAPERVFDLFVASTAKPTAAEFALHNEEALEFRTANNAVIATQHPAIKALLCRLGSAWPQRISFSELAAPFTEDNRPSLGRFLVAAHAIGVVELHTHPGAFTTAVSERPHASALARRQAAHGDKVPTLRHTVMQLEGSLSRELVKLCDGSRTHAQITTTLADHAGAAGGSRQAIEDRISAELVSRLELLARGALLQE